MNIENREEFLKLTLSYAESISGTLKEKGLNEESAEIIIEMLKDCIEFGFNQGDIYGQTIGRKLAIDYIKHICRSGNTDVGNA